ncbi:hypothetical protein ACOME3_007280 [Neoechinorhynchus agilis]
MLLLATVFSLIAFACADFSHEVNHCGGSETALKSVEVVGCGSLSDGVCSAKHNDKIKQVTVFDGEQDDYTVHVLGRKGDRTLEINAKPEHFKAVCNGGKCTLVHHYMILPAFPTGESQIDYSIRSKKGTVVVCYNFGFVISA